MKHIWKLPHLQYVATTFSLRHFVLFIGQIILKNSMYNSFKRHCDDYLSDMNCWNSSSIVIKTLFLSVCFLLVTECDARGEFDRARRYARLYIVINRQEVSLIGTNRSSVEDNRWRYIFLDHVLHLIINNVRTYGFFCL